MNYSITRALAEVKTLEKRFNSGIDHSDLIAVKHGMILRRPYSSIKPDDFEKNAVEEDQSVRDIEARISMIKIAIAKSNSVTEVTIGKRTMTVQNALIEKSIILPLKKARLRRYKEQLSAARNDIDAALNDNEQKIQRNIQDRKDVVTEEQARAEVESVRGVTLIDPLHLADKIKELEEEITDFEGNVDFALSESNSTTNIEIPD